MENIKKSLEGFSNHMPWGDIRTHYEPILKKAWEELEMIRKIKENKMENEIEERGIQLFSNDPLIAIEKAQNFVKVIASKCKGNKFIATIQKNKYPKVEWWTTVGASLGLYPYTIFSKCLERDGEIAYEARVEVRRNGIPITAAEALCSNKEKLWNGRDEHSIKSMAITRATAKAYRIGLSFLATFAGLEPTPAEEITQNDFENSVIQEKQKIGKFTDDQKNKISRMGKYFFAVCEKNTKAVREKIHSIAVELNMGEKKDWMDFTPGEIDQIWDKFIPDIENFERAGTGK